MRRKITAGLLGIAAGVSLLGAGIGGASASVDDVALADDCKLSANVKAFGSSNWDNVSGSGFNRNGLLDYVVVSSVVLLDGGHSTYEVYSAAETFLKSGTFVYQGIVSGRYVYRADPNESAAQYVNVFAKTAGTGITCSSYDGSSIHMDLS